MVLPCLFVCAEEARHMDFGKLRTNCRTEIESGSYSTFKSVKVLDLQILAWYRIRDSRPWYVDNALCWAKVTTEQGQRWILVHMARNPEKGDAKWHNADPSWHSYMVYDARNAWFLYFDRAPKNEDIYGKMVFFKFSIGKDWDLYDSKILNENWESAIGQSPAIKFSQER